jgi:gamma-glutamyltranspeptidase/glutathione hydrolase
MAPAIALAERGFIVDSALSDEFAQHEAVFSADPVTAGYFLRDGTSFRTGDTLRQTDLASVLREIAADGSDGFYRGWVAAAIAERMNRGGGLITKQDLARYRPVWRDPVRFEFSKLTVYSMPPPSSGGVVLGQIFGLLEQFPIGSGDHDDIRYIHLLTECFKLAYADRSQYLGDPDFVYNPVELLLSPDYLRIRALAIDTNRARPATDIAPGLTDYESEATTHFSVVDSIGNCVSLTYTLNSGFGCKRVLDGLGFFLNNEMDDFSVKPGVPNIYGLIGGEANEIAPRKRMLSSMSPTIVFYNERPTMVVGSPGGSRIITKVAQTILNFFGFGMPLDSAINVPHFHHQWQPDLLYFESGAFNSGQLAKLDSLGHDTRQRPDFGNLQAIVIQPDGSFIGASDRRGNGWAEGF